MRSMPHLIVNSITDSVMASAVADMSLDMSVSNYVRLDRMSLPDIYREGSDFSKGLAVLKQGDVYIVSTGAMTHMALEVSEELAKKGPEVGVIDAFSFPIPVDELVKAIDGTERIITLEEHFLPGGLGSAVAEVLADQGIVIPIHRIGLSHEKGYCYRYGGRDEIREYYGLDKPSVAQRVNAFLGSPQA